MVHRSADDDHRTTVGLLGIQREFAADRDDLVARHARCLLYTSDAADERSSVDLGGRRIIKKKNTVVYRASMYRGTRPARSKELLTTTVTDEQSTVHK